MGRMRVGVYTNENERGSSRPWDNVTDKMIEEGDSRYASLRVEHFVDAGIASRAAMFEGGPPPAALSSVRVSHLASKYENQDQDVVRPGSVVQPWPPSTSASGNVLTENTNSNLMVDPAIKTQLGRRSVKPPLMSPKPLPPVGLPMPDKSPAGPRTPVLNDRPEFVSPPRDLSELPSPMKSTAAPMRTPTADTPPPPVYRNEAGFFDSPAGANNINRRSSRCSIRAAPGRLESPSRASRGSMRLTPGAQRQSYRNSVRCSVRMSGASQIPHEFPRDSSFPASGPSTSSDVNPMPNGQQEYLDYSDPESLDTFGSLESEYEANDLAELETPERAVGALPSLSRTKSEEAEFPEMSFDLDTSAPRLGVDDEGEVLDVPQGFVSGKEGGKALRDLQCASVTAGNELAEQVRQYAAAASELTDETNSDACAGRKEKISRAQGELELRSRFFRRWNTRYVSIVDHAYFGAVLFLFRHDNKSANQGTIALKNSKMIVLAGSQVRELEGSGKKNGPPALFELRTAQRKYVFACLDDTQRQFWIDQLTSFAAS